MTQKTNQNPWQFDVRVRERNLKSGALTDKDLDKYLTTLPDLADHAEAFGTAQPALEQPRVVAAPAAVVADIDDEDEDEDDEEDEVEAVAAAPAAHEPAGEASPDAAPAPAHDTDGASES